MILLLKLLYSIGANICELPTTIFVGILVRGLDLVRSKLLILLTIESKVIRLNVNTLPILITSLIFITLGCFSLYKIRSSWLEFDRISGPISILSSLTVFSNKSLKQSAILLSSVMMSLFSTKFLII